MLHKIRKKCTALYRDIVLFKIGKYIRTIKKPPFPQNKDDKVLIHIGCGTCLDKRYINIDTRQGLHIHAITSIEELYKSVPPNRADLIYACHILEHIPYAKVPLALKQVYVCLKKNGVFRISVPNFAVIVEMYKVKNSLADILPPLMGGQGYSDNFHYTAYDKEYLSWLLKKAGFETIRAWDPKTADYYTFDDWANRMFPLYDKEWPISLNIEAVK